MGSERVEFLRVNDMKSPLKWRYSRVSLYAFKKFQKVGSMT